MHTLLCRRKRKKRTRGYNGGKIAKGRWAEKLDPTVEECGWHRKMAGSYIKQQETLVIHRGLFSFSLSLEARRPIRRLLFPSPWNFEGHSAYLIPLLPAFSGPRSESVEARDEQKSPSARLRLFADPRRTVAESRGLRPIVSNPATVWRQAFCAQNFNDRIASRYLRSYGKHGRFFVDIILWKLK